MIVSCTISISIKSSSFVRIDSSLTKERANVDNKELAFVNYGQPRLIGITFGG